MPKKHTNPSRIRTELERKHPDAALPKILERLGCGHEQHVPASVDKTATRLPGSQ